MVSSQLGATMLREYSKNLKWQVALLHLSCLTLDKQKCYFKTARGAPTLCSCWDVLSSTSRGSAADSYTEHRRIDGVKSVLESLHLVIHNLKTGLPYQIVAICGTAHHSGNDSDRLPPLTITIQQILLPEFKHWTDSNKGFLHYVVAQYSILSSKHAN